MAITITTVVADYPEGALGTKITCTECGHDYKRVRGALYRGQAIWACPSCEDFDCGALYRGQAIWACPSCEDFD